MSQVREIHQIGIKKDGVRYSVHVEEAEDGRLWGTWNCHECGTGGSAGRSSHSVTDAVESVQGDLERHHRSSHL